jgi:hypothetical protein
MPDDVVPLTLRRLFVGQQIWFFVPWTPAIGWRGAVSQPPVLSTARVVSVGSKYARAKFVEINRRHYPSRIICIAVVNNRFLGDVLAPGATSKSRPEVAPGASWRTLVFEDVETARAALAKSYEVRDRAIWFDELRSWSDPFKRSEADRQVSPETMAVVAKALGLPWQATAVPEEAGATEPAAP